MTSEPLPHRYRARCCTNAACGLRFPVSEGSELGASCPRCGSETRFADEAYATWPAPAKAGRDLRLALLLDNVRSLRNVGSILRTADGVGLHHAYLGGITPTPDHPKLQKTALGAESSVPWSAMPDACAGAAQLVASGARLWAIEGGASACSLFDPAVGEALEAARREPERLVVLVLGHEVSGIDPRIVAQCERTLFIPMAGIKGSLNVSVAFGIAAYVCRFFWGRRGGVTRCVRAPRGARQSQARARGARG